MPSSISSPVVPSRSPTTSRLRTSALIILPLLSIIGIYGGYILGGTNGMFKTITAIIANETSTFPGTADPLIMKYTSIGAVDHQLAVLTTFFAPVVDHKHHDLGLFSLNGLGQFGAAWMLLMMESLRRGNRGRAVAFIGTAGFLIQNISFQVTVPLFLFLHILTSPLATPSPGAQSTVNHLIPTLDLKILPFSIILSYIIPSILMTLPAPSMVSVATHQYLIAFWQPFPWWTLVIQWTLRQFFKPSNDATTISTSYLTAAKPVYQFALALCLLTHVPVLLLSLTPAGTISAATSPHLAKLAQSNFINVYVPYFLPNHTVQSLAEGVLNFLQWDMYVGSIALLLWAVLLYRNTAAEQYIANSNVNKSIFGRMVLWLVIAGPVGAATILVWERDALLGRKVKA